MAPRGPRVQLECLAPGCERRAIDPGQPFVRAYQYRARYFRQGVPHVREAFHLACWDQMVRVMERVR